MGWFRKSVFSILKCIQVHQIFSADLDVHIASSPLCLSVRGSTTIYECSFFICSLVTLAFN